MDRLIKFNRFSSSLSAIVLYGKGDTIPIDQASCRKFNIDPETGRPICDITCILRAQNKLDAERILNTMVEYPLDFIPDDVSNERAIEYVQPRAAQLPSELADWQERVTKLRLEKAHREQIEQQREADEKEYQEYLDSLRESKKESEVAH